MFYVFNNGVYLVKGSYRSCIYDFNASKLYSVNSNLAEKLELSSKGYLPINQLDSDLKTAFNDLSKLGVLVSSESPSFHNIKEIATTDNDLEFAWIEITNQCNLKCRHCYNDSAPQRNISMSFKDFTYVVDSIIKKGIKRVQIIGGEPFLNNALKEMLDYINDKFEFIEIFTNGTFVTDEWINYFSKRKIRIALSVYSYLPDEHDKVTQSTGSWKKTNQTIKKLKENGIMYRICNVLTNCAKLGEKNTNLYELSDKKDVVRMSGRANFSLLSDELIKKRLIVKSNFQFPIKKDICQKYITGHNCFMSRIYISANLKVYPCVMERRLVHCDMNEKNGITLNNEIRSFTKDNIRGCNSCEYRYACHDCRPDSLTGDIYEKPWYCTYESESGKWVNPDDFIKNLRKEFSPKQS